MLGHALALHGFAMPWLTSVSFFQCGFVNSASLSSLFLLGNSCLSISMQYIALYHKATFDLLCLLQHFQYHLVCIPHLTHFGDARDQFKL